MKIFSIFSKKNAPKTPETNISEIPLTWYLPIFPLRSNEQVFQNNKRMCVP